MKDEVLQRPYADEQAYQEIEAYDKIIEQMQSSLRVHTNKGAVRP
jgi:hypothetical protein